MRRLRKSLVKSDFSAAQGRDARGNDEQPWASAVAGLHSSRRTRHGQKLHCSLLVSGRRLLVSDAYSKRSVSSPDIHNKS